jgi:hypothetical protein
MSTDAAAAELEPMSQERLEVLEKKLSRAKRRAFWLPAAMALILVVDFVSCVGVFAPHRKTRVRELILHDSSGRNRVFLGARREDAHSEAEPVVLLSDEQGVIRVLCGLDGTGPYLFFYDERGNSGVAMALVEDKPALELSNESTDACAYVGVDRDGAALALSTPADASRVMLSALSTGPELQLRDVTGNVVWRAP